MKFSIITMTKTYNYGATLQAYALQSYIKSYGHEVNIIDHMGYVGCRKVYINDISLDNYLKLPFKKELEMGYKKFETFYNNHIKMTHRLNSIEELYINPPEADVYVTGSDQVWNPRYIRGEFYLDFVKKSSNKVKMSYAASLGVTTIPEENQKVVSGYISDFDGISVREKNGFNEISKLTKKKIYINCDPVFLINKNKWISLESPIEGIEDGYILCYMIYKPSWMNDWLKQIKKKTGKKIIFVGLQGFRSVYCDKYVRLAGPREFLWLINHAYAVITSSFHGTAFSIIFGKPFIAMPDPPRPMRIHGLLEKFDLTDRILYDNNSSIKFLKYEENKVQAIILQDYKLTLDYFNSVCDFGG